MAVRTSARAYFDYDFESTYATEVGTKDKALGMDEKISAWTLANGMKVLGQFNSVEPQGFAFGKTDGRISAEWVLSNPWWIEGLFGNRQTTGAGPYTHTYTVEKEPKSMTMEVGAELATANVVRKILGAVFSSVAIRSSVDDLVVCSGDILYGKEAAIGTTLDSTPATDDINFPYTFAKASMELPNGTPLAELQSFDITINQGAEPLGAHNTNDAVAAFKKQLSITGRFNKSWVDAVQLQRVIDRTEVATLKIIFTNGLAGVNERSITLLGVGVGISEHSIPIQPVEPLFEDLVWQIRSMSVVAINNTAVPP